jgi:Lon protease-like protein
MPDMSELLPLFPVDSVLFPGQPRALCAFDKQHQGLICDLMNGPLPRSIAVVAIHEGSERDPGPVRSMHEIGCTATLRTVQAGADGRFVLVTAGAQRFQLISVDQTRCYPRARVAVLYEDTGDQAAATDMAAAVQHAYRAYVHVTVGPAATALNLPDLPGDPVELSYNVADLMVLGKSARQALLAAPDALSRLTAEHTLLTGETALARTLGSCPAPDYRRSHPSPN